MTKYEVTHDGGDLRYGVQTDDEHVVGGPFVSYSQAEASIIAWALNAVAEGASLVRLGPGMLTKQQVIDGDFSAARYDGPTDGVAPLAGDKARSV